MPAMTFTDILTKAGTPTGCGVLVVRRDGKVLTGTRKENATRGQICGPGGHIEPGETPKRAAKREAMEEFGIICNKLVPLGTQRTRGGYGTSAVFLCTDYIGRPMADEEEMTDARWMSVEEIKEQEVFPPFLRSLKLLPAGRVAKTFDEIMKFNPYHDRMGRFASASTAASFTYAPGKSRAHDLAIQRHKERMSSIMPSDAQTKALRSIESRTRNLKKEQYRVVDRDGNIVMQKQGDKNSVSYSIGEARDNIPGNITIHNHPTGGTFSTSDLSDIGYGATEIRAAAPEGTYILRNLNYGTRWNDKAKTWYDMRDDLERASEGFKTHRDLKKEIRKPFDDQLKPILDRWEKRRAAGAPQEELAAIANEYGEKADAIRPEIEKAAREAYTGQYDKWYKENAGKYGLEYLFIPTRKNVRKGEEDMPDIAKSSGGIELDSDEIVLDRKMNEEAEKFVEEVVREYSWENVAKSEGQTVFNVYKTDEDQRLVFGWASVAITVDGKTLEDRQHDMIEPEDLEEAAYEYVLNFRDTGEEHLPGYRKKGRLVESCVFTPEKQRAMGIPAGTLPVAWWIGFKIDDEDTWQRVKNGTYRMFSIEGKAERLPVEKADRTARTFEEVLKYNHNHDSLGRFASSPGGGGRSYGSTNTGDAMAEVRSGKHNSLEKHMDANGNLTPEREKVHKEIIDKLLEGKVGVEGQATMTMLGGGPASGKSSVMSADTSGDIHAVTVDPDTIKKMLPGFEEMAKVDTNAAAFYHEESSALAKRFAEVAFSENYNVIYDGTGDGGFSSVQKKIDGARANGYRVEAKYVTIDTEEAVRRNQKRYDDAIAEGKVPRLPPEETVRKTHAKVTDVAVTMAPQFDHIEVWDNNGARGHQKKIAEGGNGQHLKVTAGNEEAFQRFLEKSNSGAEGFITLPNGQVVPVDAARG